MTAKSDLPQGTLDLLNLKVIALGRLHGYAIAQPLQQHLPHVDKHSRQGLLQLEEENIKRRLYYSRTQLGL